ncbi:hypothetical protein VIBNIFTn2_120185 [Vibrio nigripulchritudo FTn2]|uniref:hypothetical protein n=1 Tax=Vibrio nigripulchritudo TaxID=28173 RepID=UPI0003B1A2BC|nr:hypothetical protein [Vibrio nigripulchritudo]CCN40203.1 hypothetical protein VIBNIFTn2_120185 [Vibrio nigripulchritudo FTn2]
MKLSPLDIEYIYLTDNEQLLAEELAFKLEELEPALEEFGVYPSPSVGEPVYPMYLPV